MPTYTYECKKCGAKMQLFHSMSEKPRVKCEECGSRSVKRLLGTGSGIIFKGSGFYETDYKKSASKGAGDSAKAGEKKESKSESKSESKKSDSGGKSGKSGSGEAA